MTNKHATGFKSARQAETGKEMLLSYGLGYALRGSSTLLPPCTKKSTIGSFFYELNIIEFVTQIKDQTK